MRLFPRRHAPKLPSWPTPMQLSAGYAVCRSISRAAARNFYYAFLVLPQEKRNAMCAVYAFMRHADDISDDPALEPGEKRARLTDWLERFRRVLSGQPTDDPVLMALAHTQQAYGIPPALLESLVEGTAMDVAPTHEPARAMHAGETQVQTMPPTVAIAAPYATFADLYNYCYHVASVVGLICIRIFGYHNPAAEPLAERCGIAFQLTNIIRDVKEDAAMGRVYVPREDLERFLLQPADLLDGVVSERLRPLLEFETARAREFYRAADELLPLIDDDSRPALWVLVTIYRKLLDKIAARNYDVFGEKVRLTTMEKLRVLAKGLWRRIV